MSAMAGQVIGLGTDIVRIDRLAQSVSRAGAAFLEHVYAQEELAQAPQPESSRRMEYLAGRWAAKEALAKALGCGITGQCRLTEIVVLNDPSGQPRMSLTGAAAQTAAALGVRQCLVSITHEHEYAAATVVATN